MGRILAIDYGTKRTGIAVTDPLKIIANGLCTVASVDLIKYLKDYVKKENVERIILGEPKSLSGKAHTMEPLIKQLVQNLKNEFPEIPVELVDERFTSKMAFQTMLDSGLKKKDRRNKELIDEISACIILQTYLQRNA